MGLTRRVWDGRLVDETAGGRLTTTLALLATAGAESISATVGVLGVLAVIVGGSGVVALGEATAVAVSAPRLR